MSLEQIIVQVNPDSLPSGSDLTVVNIVKDRKPYHIRIKEAYQRGYRVTLCGKLFGPKGEVKLGLSPKQKYPTFSTNWGGRVYGIPVHKFAAYQFFGEESFHKGVAVRHLDADTMNFKVNNLKLGTYSENEMDKNPEDRSRVARIARSAQGFTPTNAKLSEEDVRYIREQYEPYLGRKAPQGFSKRLQDMFGVSRTVIHKVVKREYYPNVT